MNKKSAITIPLSIATIIVSIVIANNPEQITYVATSTVPVLSTTTSPVITDNVTENVAEELMLPCAPAIALGISYDPSKCKP